MIGSRVISLETSKLISRGAGKERPTPGGSRQWLLANGPEGTQPGSWRGRGRGPSSPASSAGAKPVIVHRTAAARPRNTMESTQTHVYILLSSL